MGVDLDRRSSCFTSDYAMGIQVANDTSHGP